MIKNKIVAALLLLSFMCSCSRTKKKESVLFRLRKSGETGIDFVNKLTPTTDLNVFNYLYFYNGAGVGAGDFNNDGLIDLFFASNQGANKLYLNKGQLQFKDVTKDAQIPDDGGWSTGVSVTDINNDGLLDIYVCRVSKYRILKGHNLLLVCTGIDKGGTPHYLDKSTEMGLDFSGFSTQASFIDYDHDGDLDMYLLNHSNQQNGSFGPREQRLKDTNDVSGDRLFRNDNNHFTDVTKQAGIISSVIDFGLGMCVADVNMDGYPDIYVGNDFFENDYLYLNQKNGTFKEELNDCMMHTAKFTMGVDIADANNDGLPDIFSMDMLPADPYILKRSEGEERHDVYYSKIGAGYNYQYMRNNLQYNRGNNHFSEIGLYSGISATDWSWSALLMDFDNNGTKDLFVSNGIPKRLNDRDYINYMYNEEIQKKIRENSLEDKDLVMSDKFPQIKIPNYFFLNNGNLKFSDIKDNISENVSSYSNGAVYADLDNDGDLDIAVNNIEDGAFIYQNTLNDASKKNFIELKLKGPASNITACGTKVIMFTQDSLHTYEYEPVRGYLSSMQTPLHIGIDNLRIDSVMVVWPDNTFEKLNWQADTGKISTVAYKTGLPTFSYTSLAKFNLNKTEKFKDITATSGINYLHKENTFSEFDLEPLIPHMTSTEGPALCVGDVNKDGRDDVFIGASKGQRPALFIQQANGKFTKSIQPDLDADSSFESVDACFTDVNNDGFTDLVVASGGNLYIDMEDRRMPRLYLNDSKGKMVKQVDAFPGVATNASVVKPCDFNKDGYTDLFIGSRRDLFEYGIAPKSFLLLNDKKGHFKDVTDNYAKELNNAGMITGAAWVDIDNDADSDLVVSIEWQGVVAFINDKGEKFARKNITDKSGWWNFVLPADIDGDGDMDLIAGNLGLNSRLTATAEEPVNMYLNDFDDNGTPEQILTYYINGKETLFANQSELQTQMPRIKKNYLLAGDFAKASLTEVLSEGKLQNAQKLTANYFSNAILINNGKMNFTVQAMPWQAQFSCYKDAVVLDANKDGLNDILLVGNFYENNVQMGRYDADYGTLLINKGHAKFEASTLNGIVIKGQSRHIQKIRVNGEDSYIIARNNDSAMLIQKYH